MNQLKMQKQIIPLWLFYTLVIFENVSYFIGSIIDEYFYSEQITFLDNYFDLKLHPEYFYYIYGLILLINLIGLLLRKNWARKLYLLNFIFINLSLFLPTASWTYSSPIGTLFFNLGTIISGCLFLIFVIPELYRPIFRKIKLPN